MVGTGWFFVESGGAPRVRGLAVTFDAIEERIKRMDSLPLVKDEEKRRQLGRSLVGLAEAVACSRPEAARLWVVGLDVSRVADSALCASGVPREGKVSAKVIEKALS